MISFLWIACFPPCTQTYFKLHYISLAHPSNRSGKASFPSANNTTEMWHIGFLLFWASQHLGEVPKINSIHILMVCRSNGIGSPRALFIFTISLLIHTYTIKGHIFVVKNVGLCCGKYLPCMPRCLRFRPSPPGKENRQDWLFPPTGRIRLIWGNLWLERIYRTPKNSEEAAWCLCCDDCSRFIGHCYGWLRWTPIRLFAWNRYSYCYCGNWITNLLCGPKLQ